MAKFSLLERMDDWVNRITNLNVKGKDKRVSAKAMAEILTEAEAEEIYASDDIAAKVCDMPAEDMVREGFKLIIPGWSEEKIAKCHEYLEAEMNWKPIFKQGLSWSHIYGGSGIMLGVDDGTKKLSDPLNTKRIRKFGYMHVLTRYELIPEDIEGDPEKSNCGLPRNYSMIPQYGRTVQAVALIDSSRIIRIDGLPLPRRLFIQNQYWGNSVLSRMKTPLSNYGQTYDGIASLMMDFSQGVLKIKDMARIMAAKGGKDQLQERLDLLDYARSILNLIMVDADNEDFRRETASLTGIAEIMDRMAMRLVTASNMPKTILLGESPAGGLSESGKGELIDYYNYIARQQETRLKPALRQFIRTVFLSKDGPTGGSEPDKWDLEFNPLWQEPMDEVLDRQEKQARIDNTYIKNKVITPNEVARSRFSSGRYSHDTALDFDRPKDTPETLKQPTEPDPGQGSNGNPDDDKIDPADKKSEDSSQQS